MTGVVLRAVVFRGIGLFSPQSPRKCDEAGVAMAWCVGYGRVAVSDALYEPDAVADSNAGGGRGRGSEKSRDDCSNRAVGECSDFDISSLYPVCW